MACKEHRSETPATAFLRQHNVSFTEHLYDYVEHGGTSESAEQLGVNEHSVVKTLVMPIYVERTVLTLPSIFINGGSRGFLVEIVPHFLVELLQAQPVDCAITI